VHESQSDTPFLSLHSAFARLVSKYLIGAPSITDPRVIMNVNNALMIRFAKKFLGQLPLLLFFVIFY
jgi:hypothetical protein